VLAGEPLPVSGWDDAAAARLSDPDEVAAAVRDYGDAFVTHMPVDDRAAALFGRLRGTFRLGILSNWPLAWAIDRIAERSGWAEHLDAIVVSERVGWVKPHPAIFEATATALGVDTTELLHVGDDWAADVVGAKRVGARVAYLDTRPPDSPLPSSQPDGSAEPDVVIHDLLGIERYLDTLDTAGPRVPAQAGAEGPAVAARSAPRAG
jgi:FMN phosphatase YigB (HAD superfamily)